MTYSALPRRNPMSGSKSQKFAASYAQVGLETQVLSATPEKLIALLLAGARASIAKAKLHMQAGKTPEKAAAIGKAIDIVGSGLRAAVDESTGEVAKHLMATYDLVTYHLLQANLKNDAKHLDIADGMLADVESAWLEVTQLSS